MENNNTSMVAVENQYQVHPFASMESFNFAWKMANTLCKSSLVPPEYQGEKGIHNCIIALEMSGRIGISPFMCMQNLHVIHGRPSWSAKFLIAMINACGRFDALQYRFNEDRTSCTAYTREKRTGEILEGPEVSLQMAKDEGWSTKNGSKWKTMPELMLRYRAAAFFERTYCPELSLGLHTTEEVYELYDEPQLKKVGVVDDAEDVAKALTEEIMGKAEEVQSESDESEEAESSDVPEFGDPTSFGRQRDLLED